MSPSTVADLLIELEDHNCWTIAEALGHCGPHKLQHLLSRAVWEDQQVLERAADWAAERLDDGEAVLIVDETADAKSSADAAGAARPYSGTLGRRRAVPGRAHFDLCIRLGARPDRRGALPAGGVRGRFCLAVSAAQRAADAGLAAGLELIPLSIPELLRLLRGPVIPPPRRDPAHRQRWSTWRRHHQYQARQAHQRWNAYADATP